MVDDRATTKLMTRFYQELQAGQTVNKALRDAQLAIKAMSAADSYLSHPYFWASFILTGNMQTQFHPPGGYLQLQQPPGG